MKPTISVCISAYGDPLFLDLVCSQLTEQDCVEGIYILDGPFEFCHKLYKDSGFYIDEEYSPIRAIAARFNKVRYGFSILQDEAAKRIQLYQMAQGDIILLLDLDEVPQDICMDRWLDFWQSTYAVAPIGMFNIISIDVAEKKRAKKYALFKRAQINAVQHLDYTWLVGVSQNNPQLELMFPESVLEVDHFFLLRNRTSLLQKCLFYHSLWHYTHRNIVFSSLIELAATFNLSGSQDTDLILDSLLAFSSDYNGFRPETREIAEISPVDQSRLRKRLAASQIQPFFTQRSLLPSTDAATVNFHIPLSSDQIREALFCKVQLATTKNVRPEFFLYSRLSLSETLTENNKSFRFIRLLAKSSSNSIADENHVVWTLYLPLTPSICNRWYETVLAVKIYQNQKVNLNGEHRIELQGITFSNEKLRLTGFGNCQIESIFACIQCAPSLSRFFEITPLAGRLVHMMSDEQMITNQQIIQNSDVIIIQPVREGYRQMQTINSAYVLKIARQSAVAAIMIPSLYYSAQNPFTQTVVIDGVFLDKPSPLQDLYLLYCALSYPPDVAQTLYQQALDNPDFLSQDLLAEFHRKGIESLIQRERSALQQYADDLHSFIPYSDFILAHYKDEILHYSDAHPMEAALCHVTAQCLQSIGFNPADLTDQFASYTSNERGMFPLYQSLETTRNHVAFNKTSCFLHNWPVARDDFILKYCADIHQNYQFLLSRFCKDYGTLFFVGQPLIGNSFLKELWINLSPSKSQRSSWDFTEEIIKCHGHYRMDYDFNSIATAYIANCQHFTDLISLYPHVRYRVLHVIMNPIDIIIASLRYHLATTEDRYHRKMFCLDVSSACGFMQCSDDCTDHPKATHSYQQALSSLHTAKQILFELTFHSTIDGTIPAVSDFIRQFVGDPNILLQPIETLDSSMEVIADFFALTDPEMQLLISSMASIPPTKYQDLTGDSTKSSERELAIRRFTALELRRFFPDNALIKYYHLA